MAKSLRLTVNAGDVSHQSPLVTAQLDREQAAALLASGHLASGPISGQLEPGVCVLHDSAARTRVLAQVDPMAGQLAFLWPGEVQAGSALALDATPGGLTDETDVETPRALSPITVVQKLDRVIFLAGGAPFATYTVLGARRPYFWPVLGPSGASVVRGQGTGDHPHHTGMGLAYGGHSEGGSVNIWSDWDEPPYGPGGRMVHRAFRRVVSGPVYGEVTHDLVYVDAYGEPFAEEVRTIRCWWSAPGARFLDLRSEILSTRDRGTQPFLWAVRLPPFFDVPNTGRVTNGAGYPVPAPEGQPREFRAAWVDGSGPTGGPPAAPAIAPPEVLVDQPGYEPPKKGPATGPWNGIALLDHPGNEGYPNTISKYAGSRGMAQLTQVHYPPVSAPNGPFSFCQRVFVHDGDGEAAGVAQRHAEYASPCRAVLKWA